MPIGKDETVGGHVGALPMTDIGWTIVIASVVVCFVFLVRELVHVDQCHEAREQKSS
jgi:hypothetical protein